MPSSFDIPRVPPRAVQSVVTVLLVLAPSLLAGQTTSGQGPDTARDSSFARLQRRGKVAMGVDQYTSTHRFDALPDGGRIELQRNVADPAGVRAIRRHLRDIAKAFAAGEFDTPGFVHTRRVPGTQTMAARRSMIHYEVHDLPRGAELRMTTTDPEALEAIRAFMAFQRRDHRASGLDPLSRHAHSPRASEQLSPLPPPPPLRSPEQ